MAIPSPKNRHHFVIAIRRNQTRIKNRDVVDDPANRILLS